MRHNSLFTTNVAHGQYCFIHVTPLPAQTFRNILPNSQPPLPAIFSRPTSNRHSACPSPPSRTKSDLRGCVKCNPGLESEALECLQQAEQRQAEAGQQRRNRERQERERQAAAKAAAAAEAQAKAKAKVAADRLRQQQKEEKERADARAREAAAAAAQKARPAAASGRTGAGGGGGSARYVRMIWDGASGKGCSQWKAMRGRGGVPR